MTVAVSEVVKAMRKHEKSHSVQLEALRVLLHFMMPSKSSQGIHQIRYRILENFSSFCQCTAKGSAFFPLILSIGVQIWSTNVFFRTTFCKYLSAVLAERFRNQ